MERVDFVDTIDRICDEFREKLVDAYQSRQAPAHKVSKAMSAASSKPVSHVSSKGSSLPSSVAGSVSASATRSETSEVNPNLHSMTSSSVESDRCPHGDSSRLFKSVLASLSPEEARTVRHRLRWRLGAISSKTLVSGKLILDAVSSLGLTTYSEEDMNDFVNLIADFVKLSFEAVETEDAQEHDSFNVGWFHAGDVAFRPVWSWPERVESEIHGPQLKKSVTQKLTSVPDVQPLRNYNVVPAQALMDVLLACEGETHKKIFGQKRLQQFRAIKEILLSADTNRLVSELTFVRINDLAGPKERTNILTMIEPLVAVLIVAQKPCTYVCTIWGTLSSNPPTFKVSKQKKSVAATIWGRRRLRLPTES